MKLREVYRRFSFADQVELLNLNRPKGEMLGNRDFNPGASVEPEAFIQAPGAFEVELAFLTLARSYLCDKPVAVRRVYDNAAIDDLSFDNNVTARFSG